MTPMTRAAIITWGTSDNSSSDQGVVSDVMKQFMSELVYTKLASIHQILDNLVGLIASFNGSQQTVNGGNNRGNQVGKMTRVEFLRFNGDDVRDWIFRCEHFFLLDGIPVDQKEHPYLNMGVRGIFDSGCSGHMTGNKNHLEEFEEVQGVSITFGGCIG